MLYIYIDTLFKLTSLHDLVNNIKYLLFNVKKILFFVLYLTKLNNICFKGNFIIN